MSKEQAPKKLFTEWLEQLQQESWQLELLISGFALFGIWESREWVVQFREYLDIHNAANSEVIIAVRFLGVMLQVAWFIFFINLLIHVILRGLWIGAIGLRYVSGEIDYKSLEYSDFFHDYLSKKVGRFDKYIERLEKVCSVIFAYTFLLFFLFFSFTIFLLETIFLGRLIESSFMGEGHEGHEQWATILIVLFILGGLLVFIDFITLGSIKKIRHQGISKGYSYIYRFYSFITLSFIYRPLLYNFIDYKHTRRLVWLSIPYVFIISVIAPGFFLVAHPYFPPLDHREDHFENTSSNAYIWNYYDNLRLENYAISKEQERRKKIHYISLNSHEISGHFGRVFLSQSGQDELLFEKKYGIQGYKHSGLRHNIISKYVEDSTYIKIEDQRSFAVKDLLKQKRAAKKEKKKKSKSALEDFKEGYNAGMEGGFKKEAISDIWAFKIDSTKQYWNAMLDSLHKSKLHQIKNIFKDLNQLYIDEIPYQNQLNCQFYIHPNLGEKGLLCYFPTDSLSLGHHLLTLKRTAYNARELDSLEIIEVNVPFMLLSKEN